MNDQNTTHSDVTPHQLFAKDPRLPLLRLIIFVIVAIIFTLIATIIAAQSKDHDQYDAYNATYYRDYTISGVIIHEDYADVTICLSATTVNDYLTELETTDADSYTLPELMLPTGHCLTLSFSKFFLQEAATTLKEQGYASVGVQSNMEFDVPATTDFIGTSVFVVLPQDFEHFAIVMLEENLEAYQITTAIEHQKLYLSLDEALVYFAILQEYGDRPVTILPSTEPVNPIIEFYSDPSTGEIL